MIKLRNPLGLQESSRLSSSMRVPLNGKEARKDIESYLEPKIGIQSHDTVHMLSTSLPTPTSTSGHTEADATFGVDVGINGQGLTDCWAA